MFCVTISDKSYNHNWECMKQQWQTHSMRDSQQKYDNSLNHYCRWGTEEITRFLFFYNWQHFTNICLIIANCCPCPWLRAGWWRYKYYSLQIYHISHRLSNIQSEYAIKFTKAWQRSDQIKWQIWKCWFRFIVSSFVQILDRNWDLIRNSY